MIELNAEQQKAVKSHPGRPLRLVDPTSQQAFVLLPVDYFDRLNESEYDASPWTDDEMDLLAAEAADSLGWDGLEAYQEPEK